MVPSNHPANILLLLLLLLAKVTREILIVISVVDKGTGRENANFSNEPDDSTATEEAEDVEEEAEVAEDHLEASPEEAVQEEDEDELVSSQLWKLHWTTTRSPTMITQRRKRQNRRRRRLRKGIFNCVRRSTSPAGRTLAENGQKSICITLFHPD